MALRSLAGKLRGLLPRRAAAPHPTASDLLEKELAQYRDPVIRDAVKATIEESRLFQEECDKIIRNNYRNIVLLVVGGVAFTTYMGLTIRKNLEELDKLKQEVHRLERKSKSWWSRYV